MVGLEPAAGAKKIGFLNSFRPENPSKTRFFRACGGPDFRPYYVIPPPPDPDLSLADLVKTRGGSGGGDSPPPNVGEVKRSPPPPNFIVLKYIFDILGEIRPILEPDSPQILKPE